MLNSLVLYLHVFTKVVYFQVVFNVIIHVSFNHFQLISCGISKKGDINDIGFSSDKQPRLPEIYIYIYIYI